MLIHHSTLAAARLASSTDETRVNLNGVCIEPSGRIVATDGHMLITVKRPADADADYPSFGELNPSEVPLAGPIMLGSATVDRCLKATKSQTKRRSMPILANVVLDTVATNSNGSVSMAATDLETVDRIDVKKIEGEFPSWRQVVPHTDREGFAIELNLDLLARVAKAIHAAGGTHATCILRFGDALSPVRIERTIPDMGTELVAVVMPCRGDAGSPIEIEPLA